MPGANKYSISVTNRFALGSAGEDSSSDDEKNDQTLTNMDPYNMIRKAEQDSIKATKTALKTQEKLAKQAKVSSVSDKKEEAKPVDNRQGNRRREPKGNQQQRRGPRVERNRENQEFDGSQNQVQQSNNDGPQGDRRRGKPKRQFDRRSGNPRNGVKGDEKRGGGGAYNWGKSDKIPEAEDKQEEATPENAEAEAAVEEVAEEDENKEPSGPEEIGIDEYFAQLNASAPEQVNKTRKANDGEALTGKYIKNKKIFTQRNTNQVVETRENKKITVPAANLGLLSSQRGYRGRDSNRRDNNRRDNNERRDNRGGNKAFDIMKADFPTLGK